MRVVVVVVFFLFLTFSSYSIIFIMYGSIHPSYYDPFLLLLQTYITDKTIVDI